MRFSCYPMPTGTTGTGSGGVWLPHARFQPLRFVVIEGRIASRHDLDGYWHDQTRIIGGDYQAQIIGGDYRWRLSGGDDRAGISCQMACKPGSVPVSR